MDGLSQWLLSYLSLFNVKELLIAVTESELVKRDGERIHEVPGGVVWMETRTDALINDTTDSERLVIIEMR